MPKAAQSGKQKKAAKLAIKGAKEREKVALPLYKQSAQQLSEIAGGKHGIPSDLKEIIKRYERAGRGAEKIFQPHKENALAEFSQYQAPEIVNQLGQGTAGSSAMNQAMAAAKGNLARQLNSDFSTIQSNLANNLLNQSQQAKLANLNARLSGVSGGLGQGVNPVLGNLGVQDPYLRSQKGPSIGSQVVGGLLTAGGTALGTLAGSPVAGAATGNFISGLFNSKPAASTTSLGGMNQLG